MPVVNPPIESIPVPSDDEFLWRYMDLSRFLSLLGTSELYFHRADLFDDKWEGAVPPVYLSALMTSFAVDGISISGIKQHFTTNGKTMFYVNCWHKNQVESAAMWKLYSQSNESVAIRTTVARFKDSLKECSSDIYLGDVTYCDYSTIDPYWRTKSVNGFLSIFSKRASFRHEQEVRAVQFQVTAPDIKVIKFDEVATEGASFHERQLPSLSSHIDLSVLIESVYVSPASPEWFREVVREVVSRYGLAIVEVIRSPLNDGPVY
jgi:hypothetical protein